MVQEVANQTVTKVIKVAGMVFEKVVDEVADKVSN